MRRDAGIALAALVLLLGVAFATSAGATVSGVCGSRSKLSATTPYNDDSILQHLISTRASLTCGPYSSSHQWKVKVVLRQYYSGGWHDVASTTSGWMTAKSGTVSTGPASVYCLAALTPYLFSAKTTGYVRSSSKSPTTTLPSTYSGTATRYC
jgi:hypothetical protein